MAPRNRVEGGRVTARSDRFLTAAIVLALLLAVLMPYRHGHVGAVADRQLSTSDFGAFYCAALVTREGGDPYRLAPLRDCEIARVYAPAGETYAQHGIDPSPLPPYDLALFTPFTFLPYRSAGLLWTLGLILALITAAALLHRLTGYPEWAMLAVLAVTGGVIPAIYGQLQPLITVALVSAALLLRAGKDRWAVAAASIALLEPHVALGPMLALLLWSRARLLVVAAGLGAAALALGIAGPAEFGEYFLRELPAHAFSEFTVRFQYSLTSLLYALGVPDRWALSIASLQYAVVLAIGVIAAKPLERIIGRPAYVLFPAACAVLGGPFIHITQITSALPFAVALAAVDPRRAPILWAAAALVALPWPVETRAWLALEAAVVAAVAVYGLPARPAAQRFAAAGGIALAYGLSSWTLRHLPDRPLRTPEPPGVVAAAGLDPGLASTQWAIEARTDPVFEGATVARLADRVPTWAGLALIFGCGCAAARKAARD